MHVRPYAEKAILQRGYLLSSFVLFRYHFYNLFVSSNRNVIILALPHENIWRHLYTKVTTSLLLTYSKKGVHIKLITK